MPLKTAQIEEPNLNLTPMIDVVFLLIIFFMVGTRFTEMERQFDIELPTVSDAQPLTSLPDEIVVNIRRDGQLLIDGQAHTAAEAEAELAAARKRYAGQSVVIRGDGQGRYQHVADVLAICRRAGINRIHLGVRPQPENRE